MNSKYKKGKRGVSQVITILILTLLSLTTVSIFFVSIIRTSEQALLAPKQCIEFQMNLPFELQKTCYNSINNQLEITVNRKLPVEIKNLDFNVKFERESSTWTCCETCPNCEIVNSGSKTYYIDIEDEIPKELNLLADGCVIQKKNIAPC